MLLSVQNLPENTCVFAASTANLVPVFYYYLYSQLEPLRRTDKQIHLPTNVIQFVFPVLQYLYSSLTHVS